MLAADDGYVKSGQYYWKDGQAYTRRGVRKSKTVYYKKYGRTYSKKEYYSDWTYTPVVLKTSEHDSVESLWKMGIQYATEKQRYTYNERKKAILQQYAVEMAQVLGMKIEAPRTQNVPYGFGAGSGYAQQLNQGATSVLGYPPAQFMSTTSRTTWNPDNTSLLINQFSNAVKQLGDQHGTSVQSLGSLADRSIAGEMALEQLRLKTKEKAELITREKDRALAILEASKSRWQDETTTTIGEIPTMPPQPPQPGRDAGARPPADRTSLIATKCATCHQGQAAPAGLDFTAETFSPDTAKRMRWAINLGAGKADAELLEGLGFSTDPNDENYLTPMPRNQAGKVEPVTEDERLKLLAEIDQRTK